MSKKGREEKTDRKERCKQKKEKQNQKVTDVSYGKKIKRMELKSTLNKKVLRGRDRKGKKQENQERQQGKYNFKSFMLSV